MKGKHVVILRKIRKYAEQTIEFVGEMEFGEFTRDEKTIAACVFNLSQIGELVNQLDKRFTEEYSQIPWKNIRGLRNRIVHDYEGIQMTMIWDVIDNYLSELIVELDKLL